MGEQLRSVILEKLIWDRTVLRRAFEVVFYKLVTSVFFWVSALL